MVEKRDTGFVPLIRGEVTNNHTVVRALVGAFSRGVYKIAAYQRDADAEWSDATRALFIDSVLNGVPIPHLLVLPVNDGAQEPTYYVIDGQQRMTCLISFMADEWALSEDETLYPSENNTAKYLAGKKFSELDEEVRRLIEERVVSMDIMPANMSVGNQILTFVRMNRGAAALSQNDLRLALFGDRCPAVNLIRVAGIRYPHGSPAAIRMIEAAKKVNVQYPWENPEPWRQFWKNSLRARGQLPAEMVLWYVVFRLTVKEAGIIDTVLESSRVHYDRTTASLLDAVCERFHFEATSRFPHREKDLPSFEELSGFLEDFETWFPAFLKRFKRLSPNAARKIAFACAVGALIWDVPEEVNSHGWALFRLLFRGTAEQQRHSEGFGTPIRMGGRGKWSTLQSHVLELLRVFREAAEKGDEMEDETEEGGEDEDPEKAKVPREPVSERSPESGSYASRVKALAAKKRK